MRTKDHWFMTPARGLLLAVILCILFVSFGGGCRNESPSWNYMFRSGRYQFDAYEGIGVMISEGDHAVSMANAEIRFDGNPLTLEERPAVWVIAKDGRATRVSSVTDHQLDNLWDYLYGSNGKESVEEVIRILGITEAQIADAFGRGSRPGK